ncbi:MAG: enoyl-CoA hydratase/isomerase family protein [Desulfurococcales archaeon]|nr:enoyl-CoA hydratase/isomerase family protein [Desulfurococcales archaeon]
MPIESSGNILYEVRDGVAYIVIDRPEKRNAMTLEMWRAFKEYTTRACSDGGVRVVVYRGRGGAFSAGDDIGDMYRLGGVEDSIGFFTVLREAFAAVAGCPKVTVAVVDGVAVGGGGELLLAMDYVIATRGSITGFPEIRIGLIPPLLSTLGVYVLGFRLAKKLALRGGFLSASEALEYGLFDEVVEPGELESRLEELVAEFKSLPVHAVSSIKRLVMESVRPALESGISELELLVLSREARERMRAFLEKRLPRPS